MHMNANATEIIFPWNWAYRQTVESLGAGTQSQVLRETVWSLNHQAISPALIFSCAEQKCFLKTAPRSSSMHCDPLSCNWSPCYQAHQREDLWDLGTTFFPAGLSGDNTCSSANSRLNWTCRSTPVILEFWSRWITVCSRPALATKWVLISKQASK